MVLILTSINYAYPRSSSSFTSFLSTLTHSFSFCACIYLKGRTKRVLQRRYDNPSASSDVDPFLGQGGAEVLDVLPSKTNELLVSL